LNIPNEFFGFGGNSWARTLAPVFRAFGKLALPKGRGVWGPGRRLIARSEFSSFVAELADEAILISKNRRYLLPKKRD
jgi:hypothetical protein